MPVILSVPESSKTTVGEMLVATKMWSMVGGGIGLGCLRRRMPIATVATTRARPK